METMGEKRSARDARRAKARESVYKVNSKPGVGVHGIH